MVIAERHCPIRYYWPCAEHLCVLGGASSLTASVPDSGGNSSKLMGFSSRLFKGQSMDDSEAFHQEY